MTGQIQNNRQTRKGLVYLLSGFSQLSEDSKKNTDFLTL
jgi:hypothetical protein